MSVILVIVHQDRKGWASKHLSPGRPKFEAALKGDTPLNALHHHDALGAHPFILAQFLSSDMRKHDYVVKRTFLGLIPWRSRLKAQMSLIEHVQW